MTAGRGTPKKKGVLRGTANAHGLPLLQYSVRTEKGRTAVYGKFFTVSLALFAIMIMMGAHGCEHACATCGKCNVRSCKNRVKCKGHK